MRIFKIMFSYLLVLAVIGQVGALFARGGGFGGGGGHMGGGGFHGGGMHAGGMGHAGMGGTHSIGAAHTGKSFSGSHVGTRAVGTRAVGTRTAGSRSGKSMTTRGGAAGKHATAGKAGHHGKSGGKGAGKGHDGHGGHHGGHGGHGCASCGHYGWGWYNWGWAGLTFAWLLNPYWWYTGGYHSQAGDVNVTQQVTTGVQAQPYDYDLIVHQSKAGDVLTEQVITPDKKQIVYVHDQNDPERIIEKHVVGPDGAQDVKKDQRGRIKRMHIDSPVRITTHTVEANGDIVRSEVSYAQEV